MVETGLQPRSPNFHPEATYRKKLFSGNLEFHLYIELDESLQFFRFIYTLLLCILPPLLYNKM